MDESEQIIVQLAETYKKPDEFINILEKSFEVPPDEKGDFFLQVGNVLLKFSYFALARDSWDYALKYLIKEDDKVGESECYGNLGLAYYGLGEFKKSIEYQEKSLAIAKEIRDIVAESRCYGHLGLAYHDLGDSRKAIGYHKKSLEIAKEIGDIFVESRCYTNLGLTYYGLGEFRKSIEYQEKSLAIAKETGDIDTEGIVNVNLGIAYLGSGDFRKAIEYLKKSLGTKEEIGDRVRVSVCYGNLGIAYRNLGDFRKAIGYHKKSLELAKEIGDRAGESTCYINLGAAYLYIGEVREAIRYHKKSLAIAKEVGARTIESKCYTNLGLAYLNSGDFRKAIEYLKKSWAITKEVGDRVEESKCYGNLGIAYQDLGDFRKAIKYHKKALAITKETGDIDSERLVNLNLGLSYSEYKPKLAYNYFKHSIELSEVVIRRLVEEEHKIGFYARASNEYQYMVPLCLKLKKEKEAFDYTERSKSRSFLDLLATTEIKPSVELTNDLKSLLDDEENYLAKLRKIQTRHLRQNKVSMEPGEVDRIFQNLNLIYDKIEQFNPEYVFTRRGKPLSLDNIRDMLSSQKRDVVLIEYFITRDKTFIFVISSKDNKLHIEPVSISTEKLNRYVEVYWREVVNYHEFQDIGDTWLGLSDYLIEPISEYLCEGDLIYFVPYGLLHYLPIHALELNGEPVIKKHPVAYSPSASLLKFFKNKGSSELKSCVSLGVAFGKKEEAEFEEKIKNMNKEEKEAVEEKIKKVKEIFEGESKDVAELFSTQSDNGKSATKDKVIEKCTDKDIIHFSCHGYFDDATLYLRELNYMTVFLPPERYLI